MEDDSNDMDDDQQMTVSIWEINHDRYGISCHSAGPTCDQHARTSTDSDAYRVSGTPVSDILPDREAKSCPVGADRDVAAQVEFESKV